MLELDKKEAQIVQRAIQSWQQDRLINEEQASCRKAIKW
jgi:hypothetical protein